MEFNQFAQQGYCTLPKVLSSETCSDLSNLLPSHDRAGVRNLFQRVPALQMMIHSDSIRAVADRILSPNAFAVRALLFDKSPSANWYVSWHQDLTISVKGKHEIEGFGPWSEKEGIVHVQPPASILRRMATLRLHLDDCPVDNGPLQVIPRTHLMGIIDARKLQEVLQQTEPVSCCAAAGDCVAISPLILHASQKAANPRHRRVLHLEFADAELPRPLEWNERW